MPAERDDREHGSAQSPRNGRDPVRFEWVAEPHRYSVEAAFQAAGWSPMLGQISRDDSTPTISWTVMDTWTRGQSTQTSGT
jgi:hypothetical protein